MSTQKGKQKSAREKLQQACKNGYAWLIDKILHPWQWLSPLIVFVSLGLVVYCAFLFGMLGPEIYKAWNIEQTLKNNPAYLSYAASACVLWGVGIGSLVSRYPELRRLTGILHLFQYLPIAACALFLHAGGFLWKTQTLSVICLAVLLIICVPSWLPPYKRREEKAEQDALGRGLLYHQLGDAIRERLNQAKDKGVTVAVTGVWGSGKSHFIHYLEHELQEPRERDDGSNICYKPFGLARVDVWKCASVKAMWTEIAESLASCILERDVRLYGRWGKIIVRMLKALHIPYVDLAEDILRIVKSGISGDGSVTHLFSQRMDARGKSYILVLDNLDRCGGHKLRALLPLIERLKSIPHLVTICGIAYGEMSREDKKITEVLDGTFLKIFDMVIPMPRVPEKYKKAYMLQELTDTKRECFHLRKWCMNCELPLNSPRLIKAIIERLSIIDSCFLKRLTPPSPDEALMQQLVGKLPKTDLVFTLETLRVVSPVFVICLENMSKAHSVLQQWCKTDSLPATKHLAQLKQIQKKNAFPELIDRLVQILANEENADDFEEALAQNYLALTSLTPGECAAIIHEYTSHSPLNISEALNEVLRGGYTKNDEPQLYKGLLEFVSQHADIKKSGEIAGACWKQIHAFYQVSEIPRSLSVIYVWQMLEGLYHAFQHNAETQEEWKESLHHLMKSSNNMRELSEIANTLLEYRYEPYPARETHSAVDLPKALQMSKDKNEPDASSSCMQFFFGEFSMLIADSILRGATEKKKQSWIIGQKYPSEQYAAWLKNGAARYREEKLANAPHTDRSKERTNLLDALKIEVWNSQRNDTVPAPFCVLSFATVWAEICEAVFREKSLTNNELKRVEEVLKELEHEKQEKVKASKVFLENRTISIQILEKALNKLINPNKK